ncbi:MarR family transcriptional regulator [Algoriphagus aestuarii]|nr:MarR family transcriptional regulator [Algoriphagus aestuarii]
MLYQDLSLSLYTNSRLFIQLIQNYLNEFGLTYPQYLVLHILWKEDGILVKQIGEKMQLDSGTLTPLIKKLERMNYVKRQRGEADERTVHVELTYPGKSLQPKITQALIPLENQLNELEHINLADLNTSLQNLLESIQSLKNSKQG